MKMVGSVLIIKNTNFVSFIRRSRKYSTEDYKVVIKWSKIKDKGNEEEVIKDVMVLPFCFGSGLVASGPFFNEKYKKFHIGNICETRFKDIVFSDVLGSNELFVFQILMHKKCVARWCIQIQSQ